MVIIPIITTRIEPETGIPLEFNFLTIGFAITEINMAKRKGIKISLDALNPATTNYTSCKIKHKLLHVAH